MTEIKISQNPVSDTTHFHDCMMPVWPVPPHIHALTTLRSFIDRTQIKNHFNLPAEPIWLNQVHGTTVVEASAEKTGTAADAVFTRHAERVCAILTADCLPLFLCDVKGTEIALVHAGWRGLAAGIIGEILKHLTCPAQTMLAAFGPAIGAEMFEVGREVYDLFQEKFPDSFSCFRSTINHTGEKRWLADIYALAACQLRNAGLLPQHIYGGNHCTYRERELFFSWRREGKTAGRMVSIIWKSRQVK